MVELFEDYEPEDAEQENGTATIVDKEFNFDMLRDARPSINRVKPPDFANLVFVPVNPKIEPELIDKAYYRKDNAAISVILAHRWPYYYCGCVFYNNPLPTLERIMNPCTINPIETKEEIYVINSYINKHLGTTTSQRWRRECWDRLRPILESSWIKYRQAQTEQTSKKYFILHSVIDKDGFMVPEPAKKSGRPVSQLVLDLSDEDTAYRNRLIRQHSTYISRYKHSPTEALKTLLNNIYTTVDTLGGVPTNWEILMPTDSATAYHKHRILK